MDAPAAEPIALGLLFDFPQADGGASFEEAVRIGVEHAVAGGRLDRPVSFVRELARGLPMGTAAAVERAFARLEDQDVLAVIGPSISDNGLVVRDLADRAGLPCINYTGGELTRSEYMFHYQVGSLEEEPVVLAEHLAATGHTKIAVVYDASPVGRRYAECFEEARTRYGLEVTVSVAQSAVAETASGAKVADRLRASAPDAVLYLGLGIGARALAVGMNEISWSIPVVANSALMFGYAQKAWRPDWEGWVYVDTVADDNVMRTHLGATSRASAAGPVGVAAYDIGRLVGEALARCQHLTRDGVKASLEQVKRLAASSGMAGTTMGFGCWDHAALKGPYLVLRQWRDGRTVQY